VKFRLKSAAGVCCVCGAIVIVGLFVQFGPHPHNPWLMILLGVIGMMFPFAALGFIASFLIAVHPADRADRKKAQERICGINGTPDFPPEK